MSNTEKSIDIYERLATALEALLHGFARTTSGVEIKLIKMAFTPEEVGLAGQLTRIPETAVEIATRIGRDEVEVTALLESLVPRGLVSLNSPAGTAGGGVLDQTVQGVIGCPTDAMALVPVSAEEWFHVPSSMTEWEERRLAHLAAEK